MDNAGRSRRALDPGRARGRSRYTGAGGCGRDGGLQTHGWMARRQAQKSQEWQEQV